MQKTNEALSEHPGAIAQKKNTHWMTSYGEVGLVEHRLTINKLSLRSFSQAAGVDCRDYSRILQRRIVDFAADHSYATAVSKVNGSCHHSQAFTLLPALYWRGQAAHWGNGRQYDSRGSDR